ncbi:Ribosomal protein S25 [Carpediemonas membranifera]|uniref:40S ribosomal protein S25 n=1 Tax=Carpediemonas membranifera TaxID=201153 RepID=A0A8J6B3Y5_9EUKA|nr:Ribosomal protein S25 [Carpediemonas membranifera]|eukprot:KAG9392474.1 Ribosomal protein S25 [Carpediemonas membranifera]
MAKAPKKWGMGKSQENKLNNAIMFTPAKFEEAKKFCSRSNIITISTLSANNKISGSLARALINQLAEEGAIRPVVRHHAQWVYSAVKSE